MKLKGLRKYSRALAICLLIPFLITVFPFQTYAITSGPSQEEFATFTPAQTTEMVNLYSGDFNYNIPLMTVPGPNGGYPLNLFYNSGTNINETGTWVGYGWNLNVGAINRQMRGLPDDFSGEKIKRETHIKNSFGVGLDIPTGKKYFEFAGIPKKIDSLSSPWSAQIYYDNYSGIGYNIGFSGIRGLDLSFDSQNGIGIDPRLRFGPSQETQFKKNEFKVNLSTSYNSRRGLTSLTINSQLNHSRKHMATILLLRFLL